MFEESEEFLRKTSDEVAFEEGREIASQLEDSLELSSNGIGLSAPQIGLLKRVFVLRNNSGIQKFINPIMVAKENPFVNPKEGCLSFPGLWLNTIRYHNIIIEDDLNGRRELNNFAAVIAQHEYDHLDGILFFDRRVPERYDFCFCNSGKKFKFCCEKKL